MCLFLKKSNAFTKFLKECIRGKGYDSKNATFPSLTDTNATLQHTAYEMINLISFSKGTKLLQQRNISYPGF